MDIFVGVSYVVQSEVQGGRKGIVRIFYYVSVVEVSLCLWSRSSFDGFREPGLTKRVSVLSKTHQYASVYESGQHIPILPLSLHQ